MAGASDLVRSVGLLDGQEIDLLVLNHCRRGVTIDKFGVIVSVIATLEQAAPAEFRPVMILTVRNFRIIHIIAGLVEEAPRVGEALSTIVFPLDRAFL